MVISMAAGGTTEFGAMPKITPVGIGLLVTVSVVIALCTFPPRRKNTKKPSDFEAQQDYAMLEQQSPARSSPETRSHLVAPRRLLKSVSERAMNIFHLTKTKKLDEPAGSSRLWSHEINQRRGCDGTAQFSDGTGIRYDEDGTESMPAPPAFLTTAEASSNMPIDVSDGSRRPAAARGRTLLSTLSLKLSSIFHLNVVKAASAGGVEAKADEETQAVWQRQAMVGGKCQPPEFSAVFFYDSHGNPVPELSSRSRHNAAGSTSFSFPANYGTHEVDSEPETPRLHHDSILTP